MVQLTPSTSEGERRDPPIGGSYRLTRPNRPLDSGFFEGKSRSPKSGFHDSLMVQSTPSMIKGKRRDPPIGGSYHLARPNRPLDSSMLGARADPPNWGLMTLVWSNRPPLQARVRGETPQSGAHTVSQSPIGPRFEFMRARTDPPNRGLMTLVESN